MPSSKELSVVATFRTPHAVDNPVEKVWTTCGAACGEVAKPEPCGLVWTDFGVIHSETGVIHRLIHSGIVVPDEIGAFFHTLHRAYYEWGST